MEYLPTNLRNSFGDGIQLQFFLLKGFFGEGHDYQRIDVGRVAAESLEGVLPPSCVLV